MWAGFGPPMLGSCLGWGVAAGVSGLALEVCR